MKTLRLLKAIRAKCFDCSGGSQGEVRVYEMEDCPLSFSVSTNSRAALSRAMWRGFFEAGRRSGYPADREKIGRAQRTLDSGPSSRLEAVVRPGSGRHPAVRRDRRRISFMTFTLTSGEVWVIAAAFGASNCIPGEIPALSTRHGHIFES